MFVPDPKKEKVQMSDRSFFSDLYKDAVGFRPSADHHAYAMTDYDFDAYCEMLVNDIVEAEGQRIAYEASAGIALEAEIADMVATHGITRADALRWMGQAYDLDVVADPQDAEHLLWLKDVGQRQWPAYIQEMVA